VAISKDEVKRAAAGYQVTTISLVVDDDKLRVCGASVDHEELEVGERPSNVAAGVYILDLWWVHPQRTRTTCRETSPCRRAVRNSWTRLSLHNSLRESRAFPGANQSPPSLFCTLSDFHFSFSLLRSPCCWKVLCQKSLFAGFQNLSRFLLIQSRIFSRKFPKPYFILLRHLAYHQVSIVVPTCVCARRR